MTKKQEDRPYWLALHQIIGKSLCTYLDLLLEFYGSLAAMWHSKDEVPVAGLPEKVRQKIILGRKTVDPLQLWDECLKKGVNIITCRDPVYSKELLQINEHPCILYYYGNISLLNMPAVAIIGSRQGSRYGLMQSHFFANTIAGSGVCVVSGMASGIDGKAHEGALEAGGNTIAVLGTGVDVVYPKEHQKLYQRLCREALVISEFPLGTQPRPWQFPQRNRIISGLAQAVLLIEAKAKSGALITCDYALEQGKEVCALPGPVTNPGSIGPLRLIQQGAKLVITPQDVLSELKLPLNAAGIINKEETKQMELSFPRQERLSEEEVAVLELLSYEPVHIDEILSRLDLKSGMIYVHLNSLKSKGLIDILPGNYFLRI